MLFYIPCIQHHNWNFVTWMTSVWYDRSNIKWGSAVTAGSYMVTYLVLLNVQCFLWWDVREADVVFWFQIVESIMLISFEEAIFETGLACLKDFALSIFRITWYSFFCRIFKCFFHSFLIFPQTTSSWGHSRPSLLNVFF